MKSDTIAAIATAVNNSGISIIRISGPEAVSIADSVFKAASGRRLCDCKSHTINYGVIRENDITVDEVLVSIMKAPNSYTKEDVIEINCHGGIKVTNKILNIVLNAGARIAEPGEFTKRAFLNGRIDLSQAEAVMDIINAESEYALSSSVSQLRGTLLNKVKEIRETLLYDIAFIESALDDPEHINVDDRVDEMWKRVDNCLKSVDKLIKSSDNGRLIKEGIQTVILGKPNVGKSSFLNLLAGEEVAIVTDIPGTTRDTIELNINLDNILLKIIDTAGIRESDDKVEMIGTSKAMKKAEEADLIIFILDASRQLDDNDNRIIDFIKDRKAVILLNKSDLNKVIDKETIENITGKHVFEISVKENFGIEEFEEYIKNLFFNGEISFNNEVYITNARHKNALIDAKKSLMQVIESFNAGMSEDFLTIDMMAAYESLGEITGDTTREDLANKIFKEFCMGK